ncbi:hypothetical protein [Chromobacterium alticapitis]|uniref:TonB-dependent receptor-like beta-barrel domain-containing protein n=1 Tax=Chromobacterium alticapitis TaxID=2073169 RepID=A0A2S5DGF0_9NEIS|nr:hypothetical protein [Chromobacterium alticapitis]POZ62091.1 hypothetical protein C2I19_09675 [Chromobacterium alticapitis]
MAANRLFKLLPALIAASASSGALACASCGCTLSSDWESQGFSSQPGLKMDVRYDYLNQNQLRSGSGAISPAAASQLSQGNQEVERYTRNQYLTLGFDYAFSPAWGLNVQIPYLDRKHSTLGTGSDGANLADGAYDSSTSGLGDIKAIGRYQGFAEARDFGLLFGLKLPTGSHTQTGVSTDPANPGAAAPIDRGLQPGTGTTDAIVGAYYFGELNRSWHYFTQATIQSALAPSDQYRPGTGVNLNLGLRYTGFTGWMPQLQLNARYVQHDAGDNADTVSTGGTLVYLSPGLTVPLTRQTSLYSFAQLPIYQHVNGVQLAPRYTLSVGARFSF